MSSVDRFDFGLSKNQVQTFILIHDSGDDGRMAWKNLLCCIWFVKYGRRDHRWPRPDWSSGSSSLQSKDVLHMNVCSWRLGQLHLPVGGSWCLYLSTAWFIFTALIDFTAAVKEQWTLWTLGSRPRDADCHHLWWLRKGEVVLSCYCWTQQVTLTHLEFLWNSGYFHFLPNTSDVSRSVWPQCFHVQKQLLLFSLLPAALLSLHFTKQKGTSFILVPVRNDTGGFILC